MEIDMTRHQGDRDIPVLECTDTRLQTYRVRTDFQPDMDEETGEERGVTFIETEFAYKPTMQEVRDFCLGVINRQTDERIVSGFAWNGIGVWLSEENQRNFSEAQRIAASMPEAILPVVFKLGEDDGQPVYHEFTSSEELTAFYMAAVAYINRCLAEGWQAKDSFDFTAYEAALNG